MSRGVLGCMLCAAALLACGSHERRPLPRAGPDPEHGRFLIAEAHCGACHAIPGVQGARGVVGPPLTGFARRAFIAGSLPNTQNNLIAWLKNPPAMAPQTAMPALGIGDQPAADIAAYLYQLR